MRIANNYIEFRVYLKDGADAQEVIREANTIQDALTDIVSDESAPEIFTQDVSYEIKVLVDMPKATVN